MAPRKPNRPNVFVNVYGPEVLASGPWGVTRFEVIGSYGLDAVQNAADAFETGGLSGWFARTSDSWVDQPIFGRVDPTPGRCLIIEEVTGPGAILIRFDPPLSKLGTSQLIDSLGMLEREQENTMKTGSTSSKGFSKGGLETGKHIPPAAKVVTSQGSVFDSKTVKKGSK